MYMRYFFLAAVVFSSMSLSYEKNDDCKWSSPSLRNCELREWYGNSYTIYPLCPKCGKVGSSGQSGGIRPAYSDNDKETINVNTSCWNQSCVPSGEKRFEYEYGFTVTAICN